MLRLITSLKTTTVLLLCIAAVLGLITLREARDGASTAGATYHLYGSWWLFGLLALLFVILVACVARRRRLRSPALLFAHCGLGLLLIGALLSSRGAERGMVYLAEGEQTNVMQVPERLWIEVGQEDRVIARTRLRRGAREGTTYTIPEVGTGRLVRFLPAARIRPEVRPRDDAMARPAVRLHLATPHGSHELVLAEGWADDAEIGHMRVVLGVPESLLCQPRIVLETGGGRIEHPLDIPADIGERSTVGDLVVAVLDYAADFKVGASRADGPPVNPAVRLAIQAAEAPPETLWVFSRFPGFARPRTPGLDGIEFLMPTADDALYLFHDEGAWRYRCAAGETVAEGGFAEGDTFFVSPTPSLRIPLIVERLLVRGEVVPRVEPAPESSDAPAAVEISFDGFDEPVWLIEDGPEVVMPGSDGSPHALTLTGTAHLPFWIALDQARRDDYPNSAIPRVFESTIRVGVTPDPSTSPLTLQTNRPARHGGWLIYQSEFGSEEGTTWSGLQITRDPGAPLAFIGVVALTIGLLFHLGKRISGSATIVVMLMLAAPTMADPPAVPLGYLVVSEGGRMKPLETLARDVEIELEVDLPGHPLDGFVALALNPVRWKGETLLKTGGALESIPTSEGEWIRLDELDQVRSRLESTASDRSDPMAATARLLLQRADRLTRLAELIAVAPGGGDGWWVPPTQSDCPDWARTLWAECGEHYRDGRMAEARAKAQALVREQRARLETALPSPAAVALEVAWRRLDPPRLALWWIAAGCLVHASVVTALARLKRWALVPIAVVTVVQATTMGWWIAFAGRLPLMNSWEVYSLVLVLIPILGVAIHWRTGLHHVSTAAMVLTLAGAVGHRFLPAAGQIVRPPIAILQSPWREVHILSTMVSYAFLFLAAGLCVVLLARPRAHDIQRMAHRILLAGTLLLGIGIATGAAWAYEAWGRYWGWDPKEVWALVAWLVFVAALHARSGGFGGSRGWAALVLVGLAALLFTFLGVTYLLPGLHSYG
ncbi:cytochrome c biogenesis protein CcsA [Candidatus Fermentibacteria bacterium]|nr:cytochrome c biogenesis protein CcsA [Candidatus Fermentibacteria bacterium]